MSVKEEVKKVIADTLEVGAEEVEDGKNLYDSIGVDSTEMVEICVALGKHFQIKVEANEVTKDSTPEDIVGVIEGKKS
ncbi:MAG: acyl carrier protein [Candidatus Omnitrophica bacterium]|nr:acyl carrier protein [Candidatus Omnitrophota bacterium]